MAIVASPEPHTKLEPEFLHAFRAGTLTEEQATAFAHQDPIVVAFLLLQLSAAVAAKTSPHAPSGSLAPFEKALPKGRKRKRKSGAKPGHTGHARAKPERIDHHKTHQLPCCPHCQSELKRTGRTRTRHTEDLPQDLRAEVTEHTIHRDWCPSCKKQVEPKVPDAMPACILGHRTVAFTSYLHYSVGTSMSQVVDIFNAHLQMKITTGGLQQMWHRLAKTLKPWYEQIWDDCQKSAVLNGDETGWFLNGVLVWLWCFCTKWETFYALDESRGHAALLRFFVEDFEGILVTDFWRSYDIVTHRQQKCWAHLLREMKEIDESPSGARDDWLIFAKKLRRIYGDAVRLAANIGVLAEAEHMSKVCALHGRMIELAQTEWTHVDARRLAKRLKKDGESLLTFAEFANVPATNNHAEREIRPAVLMRKGCYGSASDRGVETRAILMTIFRTLKVRGLDPLAELQKALEAHTVTGTLPPLPQGNRSAG